MRTTLTIDEELVATLRERASATGRPVEEITDAVVRTGLGDEGTTSPRPRRYRVRPASLGAAAPGVDLDRALRLADAMEDADTVLRLELGA